MLDGIWGILTGAFIATGGGVGVFIWFLKKSSEIMADRLSKKYELQLSKELAVFNAFFENISDISCEILKAFDMIIDISSTVDGLHKVNNTPEIISAIDQQLEIATSKVYKIVTIQKCCDLTKFALAVVDDLKDQLGYIKSAKVTSVKCRDSILDKKNEFIAQFSIHENKILTI